MSLYHQNLRNHILPEYKTPKTNTGRDIDFPKQIHLLYRGRKFLSTLKRANEGYTTPLEKVLRMTYGRIGPRRYTLLNKFTYPAPPRVVAQDLFTELEGIPDLGDPEVLSETKDTLSASPAAQDLLTEVGDIKDLKDSKDLLLEKWTLQPRLEALLTSQVNLQETFERTGRRVPKVKTKFKPPATNIWGKPLPKCREKNLKHEWYNSNLKAALPPLPEPEYKELHDLVTGVKKMPPAPKRRAKARQSNGTHEQELLDKQSALVFQGPKPGARLKDFQQGRPHNITPRLLRHLLGRTVLKQSPLVKSTSPEKTKAGLVFTWDDGYTVPRVEEKKLITPTNDMQNSLLFG
ncbi:hypothetical protein LTR10_012612 [Elasticomyces elasticus]|uniref:LYR motif-containing protein Cup1-like N-terminal domain-containing protein n=1 Tax=Exophiala sideris TaxID=1016849 RepID=A0ABR0JSB6_9EURO|nr:hypothetical protein LTR10_012612 [Elasticomyces elasticus]KAK5040187.1 hypothetical protein LTS07_000684 [Exophiala sideris]KAK5043387.1 hypothetical protein LTR13_001158 [Exophiala sideris]KAK5068565.1 hypothetical protein LTR69_000685 [Exophiala sideris]KAK5186163.1 hypothetical protein LTR44_001218 [Eurotiomycetes sp. CCFEE 6388]